MSESAPLISIITPSFNQAAFLEETLLSVLGQDYPAIEYIVIDGGSTDGSVAILERYADRLAYWVSEPDAGQADAINKGFAKATGKYVAWLNSDDVYLPGAVATAVAALEENPDAAFVYGKDRSVDGQGKVIATHWFEAYDVVDLLAMRIISQPAVFMRKSAFDASDGLNLAFHFMLDHQLWIQLARNAPIVYVDEFLAEAKYHEDAKNVAQAGKFADEVWRVIEWAKTQEDLAGLVQENYAKVMAGALIVDGYYSLLARQFGRFWRVFLRAFRFDFGYAVRYWKWFVKFFVVLVRK